MQKRQAVAAVLAVAVSLFVVSGAMAARHMHSGVNPDSSDGLG